MTPKHEFTLYAANVSGQKNNTVYPEPVKVTDTETLHLAVMFDHVAAEFRNNQRSNGAFIKSNCLPMDCNNDHSENPDDWKTPADVRTAFPNVAFYTVTSRNHMKVKDEKAARPKHHYYFPITTMTNAKDYAAMKCSLQSMFPAFDENALDAARFFFGAENPEIEYFEGNINLSEFMKTVKTKDNIENNNNNDNDVIHEGQRNNTLSHFAGRILKKYGNNNDKAYKSFWEKAAKCSPLLEDSELKVIWNSVLSFYHSKVKTDPTYIPPVKYTTQEFDDLRKLDMKKCKFDPLYVSVTYFPTEDSKVKDKKTCRLIDFPGGEAIIAQIVVLPVEENMILLFQNYGTELKFNLIKQSPKVWKNGKKQGQLQLFYSHIRDLCDKQGIKIPVSKFEDMILSIARRKKYNPFKDYLEQCAAKYDGHDYIGALCNTLISPLPEAIKRKYLTKFLLQMAYLSTCEDIDDTAQHFMLVLKGKQGDGKSAWLMNLLPKWARQENYVLVERTCDLKNKDHILEQSTAVLVEWGEIAATFKKSDQEEIKAYITRKVDRLRPPYFKEAIDIKRRMCLCATVNDDEFLLPAIPQN